MRVTWIDHKGKRILYADFRRLNPQEMVALVKQADDIISASPTKVLYMGNVEGSQVTREVMQEVRRVTARTGRHKIQKMAAVGVTGMKKIFFDAVVAMFDRSGTEIRSFKTEEEALDWLSE